MSTVMIPILVCSSSVSPHSLITHLMHALMAFSGTYIYTFLSPTKTFVLQKIANKLYLLLSWSCDGCTASSGHPLHSSQFLRISCAMFHTCMHEMRNTYGHTDEQTMFLSIMPRHRGNLGKKRAIALGLHLYLCSCCRM